MLFNFPFYTEDGGLHQGDQLSHFSLSHPPCPGHIQNGTYIVLLNTMFL